MFLFSSVVPAHASRPSVPPPKVVQENDGTYSVDCESNNRFARDTSKLKTQAMEIATKFCTAQGKQLKVVSLTDEKPFYGADFIKARLVFKALAPGDSELTAPAAVKPDDSGDMYTQLIKLDDLHKKGILTDAEFKAEKKKILDRSR